MTNDNRTLKRVLCGIVIALGLLCGGAGAVITLVHETAGAAMIGFGCFALIAARLLQASAQHDDLVRR